MAWSVLLRAKKAQVVIAPTAKCVNLSRDTTAALGRAAVGVPPRPSPSAAALRKYLPPPVAYVQEGQDKYPDLGQLQSAPMLYQDTLRQVLDKLRLFSFTKM
jgi:hypothetical protein